MYPVLGGLLLYPVPAVLALGPRRGLRRGLAVAGAAAVLLLALYPLHARLYAGPAEPGVLGLIRYLAYAPLVFLLTLAGGAAILLQLPGWLPLPGPG